MSPAQALRFSWRKKFNVSTSTLPFALGISWLWALGLQLLCCRQSERGRQIPAATEICVRRSPWVGFRSITLSCRMVRRLGTSAPKMSRSHTGCLCSGGDVAEAAPSCLSHLILGISLHVGLPSVLFSRLPPQSERSCPISFPWQNSEAPFYHLCPGFSLGKFMYFSLHLRYADLFLVLARFLLFIKEIEDYRV